MTWVSFKHGADGSVEVAGHAGYDVRGRDIVCASVSSLCNGMMAVFRVLEMHGHCREVSIGAEDGRFRLSFRSGDCEARDVLLTYERLFCEVEREFPAHLKVIR